jgi:hypothetical protein
MPVIPQNPSNDFQEEFKDLGKRLAYLLAAADIPQEVKEAWVTLIPEMTLEQIDKLMVILERYVTSGMAKEFEDFKNDVLKIQADHQAKVQKSEDNAMGQLDELEKMVNEAS